MITKDDIGRRVVVNGTEDAGIEFNNEMGTIVSIDNDYLPVGVEFDNAIDNGHDCLGECDPGRGYFVKGDMVAFVDDEYDSLRKVLKDAEVQASKGKGAIRHATNNNYEDQVICVVGRLLKDHPFGAHAYQVIKKTIEAGRLYKIKGPEAAYQEVLGAINYCAAMNILIKEGENEN